MVKKIFIGFFFSLLLTGCSLLDSMAFEGEPGEKVSRIGQATIKVPDYYSTSQVETRFKIGQKYSVQDLRCENKVKKCAN